MEALSQPARNMLQALNGCEIGTLVQAVKAHAKSKIQQMLEVFDSLGKQSWASENAPRLEMMASAMVEELTSHPSFYSKNGASFEVEVSSLALSIAPENPVFAKTILRRQFHRIVSLVHGHVLMQTQTTNMRDVHAACKWLSAAMFLASSSSSTCDFVTFFADCIAAGVFSWLNLISLCDPTSFKAFLSSMYKSAAAGSKSNLASAFAEMFRCIAHLLMAKAAKASDIDALSICYKSVARAPAHLASRSVCSAALCLLPSINSPALCGTVCMMIISLAKKSNTPADLEILLHLFSGDKALASPLTLLLSASKNNPSPSPERLSSIYSLLPKSISSEWTAAIAQCVQYASEYWFDVSTVFSGEGKSSTTCAMVLNSSNLVSLPALALQHLSSNQLHQAQRVIDCHSQVPPLLSNLLSKKSVEGFKVAKKWIMALRLCECGVETCLAVAGLAFKAAFDLGSEDNIMSVLSEMPLLSEVQQLELFRIITLACSDAKLDTLGVICLLVQSGCVNTSLVDQAENQTYSSFSRITYALLSHRPFSTDDSTSSLSTDKDCGFLAKFSRDWMDLKVMQHISAYLANDVDIDHELVQGLLSQQFTLSPSFYRISILLSYVDVLTCAGECLEASAVITKFLSDASLWSGKYISKDVLNCISSCYRSLHLAGFFSRASLLADNFHLAATEQVSKLQSFVPSKADRPDSAFSFISSDAAACESLRAFMNGNLQRAVHLSSLAVKLASGSKCTLNENESLSQYTRELLTLRQRFRTISCCFLACIMAAHSCLFIESQYYFKTASQLAESFKSLPMLIRQHIDIGLKACVASMQRFQAEIFLNTADLELDFKASKSHLIFEIVYHRLIRYGVSDIVGYLNKNQSFFMLNASQNVFIAALVALSQFILQLNGGKSPRELLDLNIAVCAPLFCDAVVYWCSESLESPVHLRAADTPIASISIEELESLTVAQLKSKALDLGLTVSSKAKKADLAKCIFDHQCKVCESAESRNTSNHPVIVDALQCVWAHTALNGSPSTVRNTASILAPLISTSSPSTAAFVILSATGVRARHIVDELKKNDVTNQKPGIAWWQNPSAVSVFEKFHQGYLNIKSDVNWEETLKGSISDSVVCCISVSSNFIVVTRSSTSGETISYTQRSDVGFSIDDLESLHLDSPSAHIEVGEASPESKLWNPWGVFGPLGKEIESIIEASDRTLGSSAQAKTVPEKKQWWADRDETDRRLQVLCRRLQRLLGPVALSILIPPVQHQNITHQIDLLASKLQTQLPKNVIVALMHAAPVIGFEELEPYIEATAVIALKQLWSESSHLQITRCSVVLVLPPPLHHLPWESMPALRELPVSRIICPSICFAAAAVHPKSVNTRNTYYVINPGGDLIDTQNFFEPWFSSVPGWTGCAGTTPPVSEALERMSQSHMFIYCGHGAGHSCLPTDRLRSSGRCCSSAFLMGCSSGSLKSPGIAEAQGPLLHYLLAGCPCAVANLWDVSDRDIDRFATHLIKSFAENSSSACLPLTAYMPSARESCKLKWIIGAAPVVIGIPSVRSNCEQ